MILRQVKVCRITRFQVQTALPTVVLTKRSRDSGLRLRDRFSRDLSSISPEGIAIPPGV